MLLRRLLLLSTPSALGRRSAARCSPSRERSPPRFSSLAAFSSPVPLPSPRSWSIAIDRRSAPCTSARLQTRSRRQKRTTEAVARFRCGKAIREGGRDAQQQHPTAQASRVAAPRRRCLLPLPPPVGMWLIFPKSSGFLPVEHTTYLPSILLTRRF